jgi:cysteine desulfurase/selenocysteine lyase
LLGADFMYFTGHKMGALTWIGVLWWKKEHLARLQPTFVGGWAIDRVSSHTHTYQLAPDKFEPWTPNVMWAVSLRAAYERIAVMWKNTSDWFRQQLASWYRVLSQQEDTLIAYCCTAFDELQTLWLLKLIWSVHYNNRIGLFSWSLPQWNSNKLWWYFGEQHICIRTGAHCTHPFHTALGIDSSARMSMWVYNDISDVHQFFSALRTFLEK